MDGNCSLSRSLPHLLFQPANLNRLMYLVWMFHRPPFLSAAPARSSYRDSSSCQHMQAWDVSIAAWDTVLARRQCKLLCRCEYLYKNYKVLFGSHGSGRVCLRLLVMSSTFSLHSFRPWFLTGWFKHIAGFTSRAFFPGDIFSLIKVSDSSCSIFGEEEEDSHLLRKDFENAEDAVQRLTL